ncbi:hypothetical protein ACJX0J_020666, partial [Zea mays]
DHVLHLHTCIVRLVVGMIHVIDLGYPYERFTVNICGIFRAALPIFFTGEMKVVLYFQ